ncbi:MAG: hypothetical protein JSS27_18735 [Planctomycetes bacterium]|nr:hypothetical protein [Planctomycetota bacterium]
MHLLTKRLEALRRRLRRLLLGYALGWWIVAVVGIGTILAAADYLIGFHDPGLRVMSSLALLAALVIPAYRLVWRLARERFGDVDLALRIERRYPELRSRLASAVEFLDDPEAEEAGSPEMRRKAVHQMCEEFVRVDLQPVLDVRPTRRALVAAAIVLVLASALALENPAATGTALARLAQPWGGPAWPQRNHLQLLKPIERVALGQRFEVEVVDPTGVTLPDDTRIVYRHTAANGAVNERVEPLQRVGDRQIATQEQVTRPFQYRVLGGDDESMTWINLQVIEPPQVERLTSTVRYPVYTSFRDTQAEGQIRALVGSRVALSGTVNKPVRSVTLVRPNEPEIKLDVAEDGLHFDWSLEREPAFLVTKGGPFTLDLEDREGFHGGLDVRYEVVATTDRPPTVTLELPTADVYVTPEAEVPVRVSAKDDLALKTMRLLWQRSEDAKGAPTELSLFTGPDQLPAGDFAATAAAGHSASVDHRWGLSEWKLKPGVSLTIRASAIDYHGAEAQSPTRRVIIVSRDELQDRLSDRQSAILGELARMLKLQQDARQRVAGLQIQLDQAGQASKQDVDHLQQAELTQRKVQQGIGKPETGLPSQVKELLTDLENNKIESVDVAARLDDLLKALEGLGKEQLPTIAGELTTALKELQSQPGESRGGANDKPATSDQKPAENDQQSPAKQSGGKQSGDQQQAGDKQQSGDKQSAGDNKPSGESQQGKPSASGKPSGKQPPAANKPTDVARSALAEAGAKQDETIDTLEQMLGQLSEWDNYRRFHRDVGQLRREQEQLARDTEQAAAKTQSNDLKNLKPQQLADLKKLGARQSALARNLEKLEQRMQQMGDQLRENDPLAATTLEDALHQARQQQLAGQMREAARQVEQNQTGQASAAQQQVQKGLESMLDVLANRRERELGRLVSKLREAENQLADLLKRQEGLRKKMNEAAKIADPKQRDQELQRLTKEQKQLQAEAERMARSLQRLQADKASRSAGKASSKMAKAGQQGESGHSQDAAEQAKQAEQDLAEAQSQLAQQRKKAEQDLANELMASMEDTLRAVRQQQLKLHEDTRHYDEIAQTEGGLKRAQWQSLRELGRAQRALSGKSTGIAEQLGQGAPAFDLALRDVARHMTRAAEGLDQRITGEPTQRPQQDADKRLAQLLDALKPDNNADQKKQQQQQGGGGEGGGKDSRPRVDLSELKLLKLMQQGVNDRVRQLTDQLGARKPTKEQLDEITELSRQQGEIADLLLEITKPAADPEKDNLDDDLKKMIDPERKAGEVQP